MWLLNFVTTNAIITYITGEKVLFLGYLGYNSVNECGEKTHTQQGDLFSNFNSN